MKIAIFSAHSYDRQYFTTYNTGYDLHFIDEELNEGSYLLAAGAEVICVFVNDIVNRKVLEGLDSIGVRLIALRCAGFNNVDLIAAKELGITVVRVPAYSPHAVAEFAVALILTLNRKTHKAYNRVREGNFSLSKLTGFDLYGKTVGVIGTGRIGQVFASIMKGFGCRVLAFDLIANRDLESQGVEYMPLIKLLPQCDIISLHCPLTEQTRHLVNSDTLGMMKKGCMLINTSRGALVDTKTVINGLRSGQIGYLGLDVYEQEEKLFFHNLSESVIPDDDIMLLASFPNVLITSHQGFFTAEALTEIARTTFTNISEWEKGGRLNNQV